MPAEMMKHLREAINKTEVEELRIADRLSAMVCERDHKDVNRTGTFEEAAARLQTQLFDRQRTVDLLKPPASPQRPVENGPEGRRNLSARVPCVSPPNQRA
jgi:hypothetical protein